jgi:uncharacterized FAD-dependent dehydrogenase
MTLALKYQGWEFQQSASEVDISSGRVACGERKESETKKAKGDDVVLTTGRRAAMKRSRKAAEAKAPTTRKHRAAGIRAGPTRAPYI